MLELETIERLFLFEETCGTIHAVGDSHESLGGVREVSSKRNNVEGSSNGRTSDFDPDNLGSSPSPSANKLMLYMTYSL